MRVVVTATNDEGSQSATSDPSDVVAAVAPGNTAPPSATGSAADEQVLTADDGDWTGTGPFDVDYQWQRCDSAATTAMTSRARPAPPTSLATTTPATQWSLL